MYVCAIPAHLMPCEPPPPPPANPCTPPTSSTFFCNATTNICYTHHTAATTHSNAVATCRAQGGELWYPRSADDSGAIESAFGLMATNGALWLGLKRAGLHSWRSVDGSYWVPEWPTTGASYGAWAHWGSDQYAAKLDVNMESNCVLGQTWLLQYAGYTCDPGSAASRVDGACYQKAASFGAARHLAWRSIGCGGSAPYVCMTPASAFNCPPPPQPSVPPPPPVCECLMRALALLARSMWPGTSWSAAPCLTACDMALCAAGLPESLDIRAACLLRCTRGSSTA
jgi:hypothetical protein